MVDLSKFDVNAVGNRNNNIFGLPFSEEDAQVVLLAVPWEVTVSCNAGTARAPEHIFRASTQIDLFDMKPNAPSEIRGPFNPIKTNVPWTKPRIANGTKPSVKPEKASATEASWPRISFR